MRLRLRAAHDLLALTGVIIAASAIPLGAQPTNRQRGPLHTPADVRFMQGMIAHHAQALVMAAMAPTHGAGDRVILLSRKIIVSQKDEIALMQTWLRDHGERVPDPSNARTHDMHMSTDTTALRMPGMLTPAQLTELDRTRDANFERLFLADMIQHHQGALVMVATLFATPGAGQTSEIFAYATGVDADQRAEIARMTAMLSVGSRKAPHQGRKVAPN